MNIEALQQQAYQANMALVEAGLVVLTWGNASAAADGVMAIKPSGVDYPSLRPADMVVLEIQSGRVIHGTARPSSDTPTHLHLYRCFPGLGGVAHTHSTCGTSFAQASRAIPCLGTTHADHFYGAIPVTRQLTEAEIAESYELNTGRVIEECFRQGGLNALNVPGVLVASHAPFTWGSSAAKAVENAIVLEYAAQMALHAMALNRDVAAIPMALLNKHFFRKHGPGAYYGQNAKTS